MVHQPMQKRDYFRLTVALACCAGLSLTSACAAVGGADVKTAQLDLTGSICWATVMVKPGTRHYDACTSALAESVAAMSQVQVEAATRGDCMARGLRSGSPELDECIVTTMADRSGSVRPALLTHLPRPRMTVYRSFFIASPAEIRRREQLACAQLDLDPASVAFDRCVGRLSSSLAEADVAYANDRPDTRGD